MFNPSYSNTRNIASAVDDYNRRVAVLLATKDESIISKRIWDINSGDKAGEFVAILEQNQVNSVIQDIFDNDFSTLTFNNKVHIWERDTGTSYFTYQNIFWSDYFNHKWRKSLTRTINKRFNHLTYLYPDHKIIGPGYKKYGDVQFAITGKCKKYESFNNAAIREVSEEIGITINTSNFIGKPFTTRSGPVEWYVYLAVV